MKTNVIYATVAASLLTAGAAFAGQTNQGLQQIADFLGVDAGAYSASELTQMLAAREAGEQSTFAYLRSGEGRAKQATGINAGQAQMAAQAGVSAADYTIVELNQIRAAQRSGDTQALDFYLSHQNRNTVQFPSVTRGRQR